MDWKIFYLKDNQNSIKLKLYIPLVKPGVGKAKKDIFMCFKKHTLDKFED